MFIPWAHLQLNYTKIILYTYIPRVTLTARVTSGTRLIYHKLRSSSTRVTWIPCTGTREGELAQPGDKTSYYC